MLRKTTATCSAGKYRTRTPAPGINAAISVISTVYTVEGRRFRSRKLRLLPGPAHEFLAVGARSPAHEFFCSRKLRLAPQDYSPWTPPADRFLVRSYPPASRGIGPGRATDTALPHGS